jgi:ankyrin repeat protein
MPKVVQTLLKHGALVNERNNSSLTALEIPCSRSDYKKKRGIIRKTIKMLIKHGACVDAASENTLSPLDWLFMSDDLETSRLLLQHGAKPPRETMRLARTIRSGAANLAEILFDHGAGTARGHGGEAVAASPSGRTLLHHAVAAAGDNNNNNSSSSSSSSNNNNNNNNNHSSSSSSSKQ